MGKFVVILLLCAFLALCGADEVKKETTAMEELIATIEARANEVKEYINSHVSEDQLKQFAEQFAEHGKKFIADTQASLQTLGEKKA
ncbi:GH17155 [Drosophila grimshawi]|uniref:GH17155 n=1 Tax=Drosophila grimshawi TaxID=7222 RepID=B4J169_DROGR|nr:GH17155 [Drosophila grimshawi]